MPDISIAVFERRRRLLTQSIDVNKNAFGGDCFGIRNDECAIMIMKDALCVLSVCCVSKHKVVVLHTRILHHSKAQTEPLAVVCAIRQSIEQVLKQRHPYRVSYLFVHALANRKLIMCRT